MPEKTFRKYYDKSLDGHAQGNEVIKLALRQGVLTGAHTDILDIDNQSKLPAARKKILQACLPSSDWNTKSNSWAESFNYIWQALFFKMNGA